MKRQAYLATAMYGDTVNVDTVNCFAAISTHWPRLLSCSLPTHLSRNHLVRQFLETDGDVMVFIDSDMTFTKQDIRDVIALTRRTESVVGGLYVNRRPPFPPAARRVEGAIQDDIDNATEDLLEVDGVGSGFMGIHRSVLSRLTFPWFYWEQFEDGSMVTDDYWFCAKVKRELQLPIYLAPQIRLGHVGLQIVTYDEWVDVRDNPRYQEAIAEFGQENDAERHMREQNLPAVADT